MDKKKTGELIRDARIKKNYTQSELGGLIGVSNKAVSRWETGESFPDIGLLESLSNVLDLKIQDIVVGEIQADHEAAFTEIVRMSRLQTTAKRTKIMYFAVEAIIILYSCLIGYAGLGNRDILGGHMDIICFISFAAVLMIFLFLYQMKSEKEYFKQEDSKQEKLKKENLEQEDCKEVSFKKKDFKQEDCKEISFKQEDCRKVSSEKKDYKKENSEKEKFGNEYKNIYKYLLWVSIISCIWMILSTGISAVMAANGVMPFHMEESFAGVFLNSQLIVVFLLNLPIIIAEVYKAGKETEDFYYGTFVSAAALYLAALYGDVLHRLSTIEECYQSLFVRTVVVLAELFIFMIVGRILKKKI